MSKYLEVAREVISTESEEIATLIDRLDENFDHAVEVILGCTGRVIVAGMGKSGLIGKKIVATFNSTGISSFFLHPAEAVHGDMGLLRPEDVLMLISKSGQITEVELLIANARRLNMPIIALCGTVASDLYHRVDYPINCSVEREACPNNLVPTSSSTAALVMGDALAVALLKARRFTASDFAELHPAGFLGKRLLRKISEVHHSGDEIPLVAADAEMKDVILQMTSKRLGCVLTIDGDRRITGFFTDGDLRRLVESHSDFYALRASDVMIKDPKSIPADSVLDAALAVMERHSITQLPTVDSDGRLAGIVHLHDILRSKLV